MGKRDNNVAEGKAASEKDGRLAAPDVSACAPAPAAETAAQAEGTAAPAESDSAQNTGAPADFTEIAATLSFSEGQASENDDAPRIPSFLLTPALPAPTPSHTALLGPSLADISAATGAPATGDDLVGAGHPARAAREGLRVESAAGGPAQGGIPSDGSAPAARPSEAPNGSPQPEVSAPCPAASAQPARMTAGKRIGWLLLFLSVPVVFLGLQVVGVLLASALGGLALAAGAREAAAYLVNSLSFSLFLGQALLVLVGLPWWRYIAHKHRGAVDHRPVSLGNAAGIVAVGVGFQLVLSVALTLVQPLVPALMESYESTVSAGDLSDLALIPLLATALGAPVAEELFCRGLALTFAQKATGRFWAANILQALMFGVLHGNLLQGAYAFLSALVLGLLYRRYGRIGPCIGLHFALNASSYLVAVLPLSLVGIAGVGALLLCVGWLYADLPLPRSRKHAAQQNSA